MPCKSVMRRIIWECCYTDSPSSQPQLGPNRQADAALLISPPFSLVRSQHPLNKKAFLQSFLPFWLVCTGDLRRPLEVPLFSLWLTVQSGGKHMLLNLSFLPFLLLHISSCFRFPPTSYPQIRSLQLDGCKAWNKWNNVGENGGFMTQCFLSLIQISLWFRVVVFFFFLGREGDKVKHTGIAAKGDEAKIGTAGVKTDVWK